MKVVVTGASSFVGCHLIRYFAQNGYRVIGTISRSRNHYSGIEALRLEFVEQLSELQYFDLCQQSEFIPFIEKNCPQVWIHHAGYATNYSSQNYDRDAAEAINVRPLYQLYKSLAGGECGVILTGSSMEYGPSMLPDLEDEKNYEPSTPYGQSKLAETLRAKELAEIFDVPTRIARLYIPFGTFDNPAKLLPSVIAKLSANVPIDLSPCMQRRDFIGISDVCIGYERLIQDFGRQIFDVFNIASGVDLRVRDLLIFLADRLESSQDLLRFGSISMRQGESEVSYASVAKARQLLSWNPRPIGSAIDYDLLSKG